MRLLKVVFTGLFLTFSVNSVSGPANAATATTTFQVTANINALCGIAATDLVFGDYVPALAGGPQLDGQSSITLACTKTTQWNVGLNAGTGTGATVTTRKMSGPGGAVLNYGLFTYNTHTTNWGDTVGTDTVSGDGS